MDTTAESVALESRMRKWVRCPRNAKRRYQQVYIATACVVAATLYAFSSPRAATPYEFQLGGFVSSLLQTIITGEFAGRSPSNADAPPNRPICKPGDYDDLRAATNDRAAFDAFRRRCNLVEGVVDETHIHVTAYLPSGYCEILKAAFDGVMAEHVYATPANPKPFIEYKGSRSTATGRTLARNAKLRTTCRDDGSLRISAPREPK
jgi:hypothetical protein